MGSLESLQELREHLLFSLLASHHIGVLVGLVDTSDVVDVDHATAIRVHLVEGSHDDSLAGSVHGATDGAQELIVLNQTTSVEVKVVEQGLDLTLRETEHVVLHGLVELELVKRQRVVVVHDAELLGKTDNAAGTTSLQLVTEALEQVLSTGTATGRSATNIAPEDLTGKLTVVEGTRLIFVVDVEKRFQILLTASSLRK